MALSGHFAKANKLVVHNDWKGKKETWFMEDLTGFSMMRWSGYSALEQAPVIADRNFIGRGLMKDCGRFSTSPNLDTAGTKKMT
jgi:hypothetical protein